MKKIKKSSELLWLLGITFVALGVAICSKADLGVSMIAAPAFIVHEALSRLWSSLSVGVVEYLIQGAFLLLLCVVVRKFNWRYLLAFAVAVLYGYMLNLFIFLLGGLQPDTTFVRWLLLILGDMITALGVACFFCTYMPLQVFELFVAEVSEHFHIDIHRVKLFFDLSLLLLSVILALTLFGDVLTFDWTTIGHAAFHSIGLGTLITTLINAPLIRLASKWIARIFDPSPLFPSLKAYLKRSNETNQ